MALSHCPGFGSRTLRKLRDGFGDPIRAWEATFDELVRVGISEKLAHHFLKWRTGQAPDKLAERLEGFGIRVIFATDVDYPLSLSQSSDPPEALFVRGTLADRPMVSIVGTRRASTYGKKCTQTITAELCVEGLTIVSGMALGIDACVHQSCLEAGGQTVAVLGTGIDDDSLYPRENFGLGQRILTDGGAIISEFPPGTQGRKEHFPMRNRIIASLSMATVVIEATEKSGSLITAKLALEENREVLAVPGPIWNQGSSGCHALIRSGAKLCASGKDVLEAIAMDRPELIAKARATLPLDLVERQLVELLKEPTHVDAILGQIELTPSDLAAHLTVMELKGLVTNLGSQVWIKASP